MHGRAVIHGTVQNGFEPVWQAFVDNFERRGEVGASFCATVDGEVVADLWGGVADTATGRPWQRDTISLMFSSTKGIAAVAMLMLHDRGLLDHTAPVAEYWPEFGYHGKQHITVETLLNHRSGLSGLDRKLSLRDLEIPRHMAAAVEAQTPMWKPGSAQGYGAIAWGILVSELFRRVAGQDLGSFIQTEIAEPLGADFFLGLPPRHDERVATLYPASRRDRLLRIVPRALFSPKVEGRVFRSVLYGGKDSIGRRVFGNPRELGPEGIQNFNTPRVWRMQLAWANGMGNGRGLARIYAALALGGSFDGVRLMSERTARLPMARRSFEYDRVMLRKMGFSFGFVKEDQSVFGAGPGSFGHPGAGGALGWVDPERRVSVGYSMNKMDFHIRSPRAKALAQAVFRCL